MPNLDIQYTGGLAADTEWLFKPPFSLKQKENVWSISTKEQDKTVSMIVAVLPREELTEFARSSFERYRSSLLCNESSAYTKLDLYLKSWQETAEKAVELISEEGITMSDENFFDDEFLPKMNREIYVERIKEAFARDAQKRGENIERLDKICEDKRRILEVMLEAVRREL